MNDISYEAEMAKLYLQMASDSKHSAKLVAKWLISYTGKLDLGLPE